jgi:hypothetical protein
MEDIAPLAGEGIAETAERNNGDGSGERGDTVGSAARRNRMCHRPEATARRPSRDSLGSC